MTIPDAARSTRSAHRPLLQVIRDLVVVGLCALLVTGFLLDVARGAGGGRPAARSAARLAS